MDSRFKYLKDSADLSLEFATERLHSDMESLRTFGLVALVLSSIVVLVFTISCLV